MSSHSKVLVVEDDGATRTALTGALLDAGFRARAVGTLEDALGAISESIDVLLVDVKLGEHNGLDLLVAARALAVPPEVILITGYASLESCIAALRGSAFDYLVKPVAIGEVISVVERAAARRARALRRMEALRVLAEELEAPRDIASSDGAGELAGSRMRTIKVGQLQINTHRRMVAFNGRPLHLTPTEYTLIVVLAESVGRLVSSDEIVRQTHSYSAKLSDAQALLRGHIRNLRRKIPDGYLVTVRGNGYMLTAPEESDGVVE